MRRNLLLAATLAVAASLLVAPGSALGREPANQNDPCSTAGRNTCGTNGVGQYKNYRYGIRWFGDFRGAVPDAGPTFCIDLRWWYPARRYNFRELPSTGQLRNTNGAAISLAKQHQMAYALWTYGRSNNVNQQSAVMLYVHSLMGDGAPGEVDPAAISPAVVAQFNTIRRNSQRFRGPYRVVTTTPTGLSVGTPSNVTVRVLSATGFAVPNVDLAVTATGATGIPTTVRTNSSGAARINFTPSSVAGLNVSFRTEAMASNLPRIFKASTPLSAARNGQRMAAADSQRLTAEVSAPVARGVQRVTTTATPAEMLLGESNTDRVQIAGAPGPQTVTVNVYGPFPSKAAIVCTGTPAATFPLATTGSGTFTTQPFTPTAPGWYTYQLSLPGSADVDALVTPCAEPSESFRVRVQPRVRTIVSSGALRPNQTIFDRVLVENTGNQAMTVRVSLYGPFPSRTAIACDRTPVWTGTVNVAADGEYQTDPVALTIPGYYTYRESIVESEFVRPVEGLCGDAAETATVIGTPQITTQVSSQETTPGSQITDRVIITGLGVVSTPVQVQLWGPFNSLAEISCSGTPFATQEFTANGDGTYTTEPITIDRAGYFTYTESLPAGPANDGATTRCGEAAETTLSKPAPAVTTLASADVVRPGAQIFDRVNVTGLGKTPATVEVDLFGPFATRDGIRCTGTPVTTLQVPVTGDGQYSSPRVTVPKVGFYAFRERLLPSGLVPAATGECGLVAETSLGRPLILTGRGDPVADQSFAKLNGVGGATPTRVQIEALRINARVNPVGIDLRQGILAVPIDIQRLGWWRDGAAPGDPNGSVLIAGHVDSARRGGGAFVNLKNARAGQRIRVTTSSGSVKVYRITTVRRMLKTQIPTASFSTRGRERLTLVTCGGPFLRNEGSYRDNVVVTAVPV